jgi:hypothetical protein
MPWETLTVGKRLALGAGRLACPGLRKEGDSNITLFPNQLLIPCPLSSWRVIMRQIKTIIERTPEGFDAQVNAAIQEIGSEHLREIRTMMSTPTAPDGLSGAFIAILIYDLLETGQEEL